MLLDGRMASQASLLKACATEAGLLRKTAEWMAQVGAAAQLLCDWTARAGGHQVSKTAGGGHKG